MKKTIIAMAVLFITAIHVQAQGGFNLGAYVGIPVADGGDVANLALGFDANYLFEISEKFSVGPTTGFSHSFGENNFDAFQFIPIAAAGRFNINDMFTAGIDLGYAIGINDGNNGGVYFRPTFAYNVTDRIQVNASYIGVALGSGRGLGYYGYYDYYYDDYYYNNYAYNGTFSIISVGATFNLN